MGSSRCSPSRDESCSQAATPRTLLPRGSSRGLCAASPICPGRTAEIAAAHPALGRHADPVQPLAGVVVHPARTHHRQHRGDHVPRDHLLPGRRVHPGVGQRGCHDSKVPGRHHDRALPEVHLHLVVHVVVDQAGGAHEVGDGAVPVAGVALRGVDVLVDVQRAARERGQPIEDPVELLGAGPPGHERRRDDRTGVHHRVERPAADVVEADRVERVAGRLGPDLGEHRLGAAVGQRQCVDERLGDRLDREGHEVAGGVDSAIEGREAQPARGGVSLGQLGDVVSDLPGVDGADGLPHLVQQPVDRTVVALEHRAEPSLLLGAHDGKPVFRGCCGHVPVQRWPTRSAKPPPASK